MILFKLTEKQKTELAPLFEQAKEAFNNCVPGLIILQLHGDKLSEAAFLPEKYALKIQEICNQWLREGGT